MRVCVRACACRGLRARAPARSKASRSCARTERLACMRTSSARPEALRVALRCARDGAPDVYARVCAPVAAEPGRDGPELPRLARQRRARAYAGACKPPARRAGTRDLRLARAVLSRARPGRLHAMPLAARVQCWRGIGNAPGRPKATRATRNYARASGRGLWARQKPGRTRVVRSRAGQRVADSPARAGAYSTRGRARPTGSRAITTSSAAGAR
jgi:hypothetical protein